VSAYVIYQAEVTDPATYDEYRALAGPALEAAGGRYLARGGEVTLLEGGAPPGRTVVMEFPSREAALAWYHGELYRAAREMRRGASITNAYVIDGVE
jgi:uncharacterized protein (DUF1330 family)